MEGNGAEVTPENKTTHAKGASKTTGCGDRSWKVLCVVLAALVGVVAISGGLMAGMFLQKRNMAAVEKTPEDGEEVEKDPTEEKPSGELSGAANLLAEDDNLSLAFLKLHNEEKNSCFSPLSVRYALEMLKEGADGETKAQIEQLIGSETVPKYENVADHMSVANSLWVRDGALDLIKADYRTALQSKFGAEIKTDTFQSAANVNKWISDGTMGLIQQAMENRDVEALTAMLVNVLAIDMNWETEFPKMNTFGGYFDFDPTTDGEDDQYTMMQVSVGNGLDSEPSLYYNLADEATVFATDLKEYNGTRLQFVAIMPKEDLTKYVENVNNEDVNTLLKGLVPAQAKNNTYNYSFRAYIPKFGIDGGSELLTDLKALGVTKAFQEGEAELSRIMDGFFVNAAMHKTKFDFSEEGIRAAAVTAIGGLGMAMGPGPIPSAENIVVSISRPFMYMVRDKANGEVWFTGTVYDPNRWADDRAQYGR